MENSYGLLIFKINEFTRKFYFNKLLRGTIYTTALLAFLYLFLFTGIYYTHPVVFVKTILFFSFLLVSFTAISLWILKPLMALFKVRKNMSLETAAGLIGNHLFTVKDKLLNTLQLKALADQSPGNNQLILAGIDQKIVELKPIPFTNAVQLQENRKYIRYILIPLFSIFLIALLAPSILKEGTSSFVQYDKEVLAKAPFDFILINNGLTAVQGDDFKIQLKITGTEIPQEIYINEGTNNYKLEKEGTSRFYYTFKNLQNNKEINFTARGFNSASYTILVKPRPSILNVSAVLHYPSYLEKKDEDIQHAGDLLVPEGTTVTWKAQAENSSQVIFILGQDKHMLSVESNFAKFSAVVRKNYAYQISPKHDLIPAEDSLTHQIVVIKDQHPTISVTRSSDSLSSKALYFSGALSDDHGFSGLKFVYSIQDGGKTTHIVQKLIPIKKNQLRQSFFFFWNLTDMSIKPGQDLIYYFEVADNDGVNGAKITRSEIKNYKVLTAHEISEKLDQGSLALKNKMESAIKLAGSVEKESEKLAETLLDKNKITSEDKKQVEQLLYKQNQLEETVREIKKLNEKNTFEKQENNTFKDELVEKQKQIDDLFKNVLNEKTKALLEKLQSLMNQNDKDQTQDELSKMQIDNKSLKNELDRLLELYKQLEVEQSLQGKLNRLNELAKAQNELAKKSADQKTSSLDLKTEQTKLSGAFEQLKKELRETDKKNKALDRPKAFENPEKEMQGIEQQQKNSEDQLNKNNKSKAAESQQKAADQMQQLAEKLKDMQEQSSDKENEVNTMDLRKLLENLLTTSFEQEKVLVDLRKMSGNDLSYTTNAQKQHNIKDNIKTISDSLLSLSKRVPQIEKSVNEEMQKINFNVDKSLAYLAERQTAQANRNQQYTMTSINNLALMLNEALEQLQNMKKNSKGNGKGKKKQNMQQLQQMQEQLNNAIQKAKEQMKKDGNKSSSPKGSMSEEFAKMAQRQQMIRESLQKLKQEENMDGNGKMGNLNQVIKDMKITETELVNKRIEQQSIDRQKNLLIKLLDAEKAEREQDQDSKRESKAGKDFPPSYRQMLDKFNKQQQAEQEILEKLPPDLNYYYKNRINDYFKSLNSPQ